MFGNSLGSIDKLAEKKKSDKLAALTRDKKAEIRLAAIDGLGKCDDETAYNTLVAMLHDPDAATRGRVALALMAMGNVKSRAFIEHQMQIESDAAAKRDMEKALVGLREKY